MTFIEEMSIFAVIDTFISGRSGSSIEPSSKFSAGEGAGTKTIEGAGVGSISPDKLVCKQTVRFKQSNSMASPLALFTCGLNIKDIL